MFNKKIEDDSEHSFWISYADMLTGFLISFMVIALLLASQVKKCPECPVDGTLKPLFKEFEAEMIGWKAVTVADKATLRFNAVSDSLLFEIGSDIPTPYFQSVLERFSPTFNRVMYKLTLERDYEVKEIRFEGHTDSDGLSYFENLHLSARRASNVEKILLEMADQANIGTRDVEFKHILFNNSVSCGYSYSKRLGYDGKIIPICPDYALSDNPCKESYSPEKSRRIEIRIIGSDKQ